MAGGRAGLNRPEPQSAGSVSISQFVVGPHPHDAASARGPVLILAFFLMRGVLSAPINALGAPPSSALVRRLRAALGPQALLSVSQPCLGTLSPASCLLSPSSYSVASPVMIGQVQLHLPFLQVVEQPSGPEPPRAVAPPLQIEFVRMPRARRYILRVRPDGTLRVTVPRGGSRREAEQFVRRHEKWIARERSRVRVEAAPGAEWQRREHDSAAAASRCASRSRPRRRLARRLWRSFGPRADLADVGRRSSATCASSPGRSCCRGCASWRPSTASGRPRFDPQPALALGIVRAKRQHRAQFPARPDAAARVATTCCSTS